MSFAKTVSRILREAPVTDPRSALIEIERQLKLHKANKLTKKHDDPAEPAELVSVRALDVAGVIAVVLARPASQETSVTVRALECVAKACLKAIEELKEGK